MDDMPEDQRTAEPEAPREDDVRAFVRGHRRLVSIALWTLWLLVSVAEWGEMMIGEGTPQIVTAVALMFPIWLLSPLLVIWSRNGLTGAAERAQVVAFVRKARHAWLGAVFATVVAVLSIGAGGVLRHVDVPTALHYAWATAHYLQMAWFIVVGVVISIWARRRLPAIEPQAGTASP